MMDVFCFVFKYREHIQDTSFLVRHDPESFLIPPRHKKIMTVYLYHFMIFRDITSTNIAVVLIGSRIQQ